MDDRFSTVNTVDPSEIVATLSEGPLVLNEDLTVEFASDRFLKMFQVDRRETVGRALADLGDGQWNVPALLDPLSRIVARDETLEDYQVEHEFDHIGRKVMRLNARKTLRAESGLKHILLAIDDVTERHRLEAERDRALERSNRLLEELNHRVMNSMSLIGSVISMEGRTLSDDECKAAFVRMRNRIEAIGTLYRTLYRTAAVDSVKADDYLSAIVRDAVTAMEVLPGAIELELLIDDISLPTRIAVPLGLITNELATNSLKYAYQGRENGKLGLRVVTDKNGVEFTIWDDGPGIDEGARVDSGLGQKLVEAFVQQLGGALSRTSGKGGTRHILAFSHSEISQSLGKHT